MVQLITANNALPSKMCLQSTLDEWFMVKQSITIQKQFTVLEFEGFTAESRVDGRTRFNIANRKLPVFDEKSVFE